MPSRHGLSLDLGKDAVADSRSDTPDLKHAALVESVERAGAASGRASRGSAGSSSVGASGSPRGRGDRRCREMSEDGLAWLVAQGCIRHLEDVLSRLDEEVDPGRHPGEQLAVGILQRHDDRVVHDVVRRRGLETDLFHGSRERLSGPRLDREAHGLSLLDAYDVALAHHRQDLHPGKIVGDEEELWGGEARGDSLSVVDVPLDDDAVDGGVDGREREVLPRSVQSHLRRSHGRVCDEQGRPALLEGVCRDEAVGRKLNVAVLIALGLGGLRLHLFESRLGVGDPLLCDGRIDASEKLPLLDVVVEVDEERGKLPRDLRADAHGRDGLKRSGRRDDGLDVASLHRREAEGGRRLRVCETVDHKGRPGGDRQHGGDGEDSLAEHGAAFSAM